MQRTGLIPLHDLPRKLPRRRNGKRIHISTIYRWTHRGVNGVVLATVQVGQIRCTTQEALAEFFVALADKAKRSGAPPAKLFRRDDAQISAARRALDDAGISSTQDKNLKKKGGNQ